MSPQHYTKNTVEASIWCNACGKKTAWRIADGRRQYCIVCYEKKRPNTEKAKPIAEQGKLFFTK
jgi:formylmethanofuran dehydrogenase subunit E